MVDKEAEVIVHGVDGQSILQIFGQVAFVGHVIMEGVVQFQVDVADERSLR